MTVLLNVQVRTMSRTAFLSVFVNYTILRSLISKRSEPVLLRHLPVTFTVFRLRKERF